jgi:hypothetical protein
MGPEISNPENITELLGLSIGIYAGVKVAKEAMSHGQNTLKSLIFGASVAALVLKAEPVIANHLEAELASDPFYV